ncbi:hypothetical protein MLD38_009535 [Melastoma candidum]|uniref:Uncharacterized protein n=1 Tax=Melastoma candidum TaxID=119954 RepID=A0ACB9RWZ7_9MYRT|nr:hypothetical protein MLD38_009535 [Melastoma candidum]
MKRRDMVKHILACPLEDEHTSFDRLNALQPPTISVSCRLGSIPEETLLSLHQNGSTGGKRNNNKRGCRLFPFY